MNYNLVENSNLYANTTSGTGNVDLKVSEIVDIANLEGTISLLEGDVLYLDCDFGARVKVEQIRYYFSSTSSSGTVASGIEFYYKDDAPDSYSLLSTNIDAGYYFTTVPGLSAPRYFRVVHTISSGTAVSGTVTGFSVLNEDDTVDFGDDGMTTSLTAETAVIGGSATIRTIPIYNDGSSKTTAYVVIDPQGTNADDLVTISTTSGGPWYGVKENAQLIANEDSWDEDGNLSNTEITGLGLLSLITSSGTGTYTTKVFNIDSNNSFIYLDIYSEPGDSFITTDIEKNLRTIEVRSSAQRPKDYAVCRTFSSVTDTGYKWLYYIDHYREDGSTIYTSGHLGEGSHMSYDYYINCARSDNTTGKTAGFSYRTENGSSLRELRAFVFTEKEVYSDLVLVQRDSATAISNACYNIAWDSAGGTWWNLYTGYSRTGYILNQGAGYYLIHLDNTLTYSYRLYSGSRRCWDMSCVHNTGKLWYTDRTNSFVRLVTKDGTEEVQRSDSNAYGIAATEDGGCWYVSGTDLIHLDSAGILAATLEDVGTSSMRYILIANNLLYITDGEYVKCLTTGGIVNFSAYIGDIDRLIEATETGVWLKTADNHIKFVDLTGEIKTTNVSYEYVPSVLEYSHDSSGHGFHFPISIDNHWQTLGWQEVRPSKYPLPIADEYAQCRITLRASSPWETPLLRGIYLQKTIELLNVYPNTAKNVYLKLELPTTDMNWAGSYNTNLKAWLEVPT